MVSVLIVAFNSAETIGECLGSLNGQTFGDFEVVLLDNASEDDTVALVESLREGLRYPLRLVPLGENRGFAGGNNHALTFATGQYVALLNPDAFAEARWLEELVRAVEAHPEAGIGASKMLVNGSEKIDSAGDGFSTALKGYKRGDGMESGSFERQGYVFGACAGAALYRREMLEAIGFFDEDFFLIYEDADLNFRAQLAGWKVLYVPPAVVKHRVSTAIGRIGGMAAYYSLRNNELLRIKNVPLAIILRCLPGLVMNAAAELLYFAIKHRMPGFYLRAKLDALRLLPRMLKKRRGIMRKREVDNAYILGMMTPVWQGDYFRSKMGKFLHG